ncbi:LysE family translocator [Oleisolibacter albus]|uniref:LysE family translocator n=1 Tax=Oleisolibacter albus TaxID=2171757 RepID=UPI000DF1E42D|nr:LysE family transporter [Oleisolibacter albus]
MTEPTVFLAAIALILLTPGPTNTLLALAGADRGLRRALPLIPAELGGYLLAISAWGLLLAAVSAAAPWLPSALRLLCAAYLVVLALRLWQAGSGLSQNGPGITPQRLFVATLLNPKGLLFASGLFPAEAFVHIQGFLMAALLFASVLVPVALLWIGFGAHLLSRAGSGPLLHRAAAALLAGFALFLGGSTLA